MDKWNPGGGGGGEGNNYPIVIQNGKGDSNPTL